MTHTIQDKATVVRSKNAGPFQLTFDLFFESDDYDRVTEASVIDTETVAEVFRLSEDDILGIYHIDKLNAIKISIERPVPSGDPQDSDIYGAQQHTPLLKIELPE